MSVANMQEVRPFLDQFALTNDGPIDPAASMRTPSTEIEGTSDEEPPAFPTEV